MCGQVNFEFRQHTPRGAHLTPRVTRHQPGRRCTQFGAMTPRVILAINAKLNLAVAKLNPILGINLAMAPRGNFTAGAILAQFRILPCGQVHSPHLTSHLSPQLPRPHSESEHRDSLNRANTAIMVTMTTPAQSCARASLRSAHSGVGWWCLERQHVLKHVHWCACSVHTTRIHTRTRTRRVLSQHECESDDHTDDVHDLCPVRAHYCAAHIVVGLRGKRQSDMVLVRTRRAHTFPAPSRARASLRGARSAG